MEKLIGTKGIDTLVNKYNRISKRDIPKSKLCALARHQNVLKNILSKQYEDHRNEFEQHLGCLLLDLVDLCETGANIKVDNFSLREKVAASALEYIQAHYMDKLSVGVMASACNTSARTLQYAFKEKFDISFTEYLHYYRMFRFRQHLKHARNVSEAAYSSGLRHMGRSSVDFELLFGVSPHQLLNK